MSGDPSKDKPSPKPVGSSGYPRKDRPSPKPVGSSGDPSKDKPSPKPVGSSGDPSKDKLSPKPFVFTADPSKDKPSPKPVGSSGDPSKDKPSPMSVGSFGDRDTTVEKDKPDTKPDLFRLSTTSPLRPRLNSSSPPAATSTSTSSSPSSLSGVASSRRRTNSVHWASNIATTMGRTSSSERTTTSTSAGLSTSGSGRSAEISGSCGGEITESTSSSSAPRLNVVTKYGNICPSGKVELQIPKYVEPKKTLRDERSKGQYGYGSIVPGPCQMKGSGDRNLEKLDRTGQEHYKRGRFTDALALFTEALSLRPNNVAFLTKRASTLMELKLCAEALADCEKAIQLDPLYSPAHLLMASINLRLGRLEEARTHHFLTGRSPDQAGLQKIKNVSKHVEICKDARSRGDWRNMIREVDAAIAAGADSCFWLFAVRAEALFRLKLYDEAESTLANSFKFECQLLHTSDDQIFGLLTHSYFYIVKANVDYVQGRFGEAKTAAEKALEIDPGNLLSTILLEKVKMVSTARILGNSLFTSGHYVDACEAYSNGLLYDPSHPILLSNRAACRFHLGQLAKSLVDCNKALEAKPNYYKALRRRAEIYAKLGQWEEAVQDYDVLRKAFRKDETIANSFSQAELALKSFRGKKVSDTNPPREIKEIFTSEDILEAKTVLGVSVIYFMKSADKRCESTTPFVYVLCSNHPSVQFFKVDIDKTPQIAKIEKVKFVPVFHLYKNGEKVKLLVCPNESILDATLRNLISQET